ncbi:hypothetical protein [Marinobacter sp.]|uniref:hypothetical protein n=1 Tax=Marinobacter sp. TaxID=50741 RepID=UPI0019FB5A4D|nr:hypothetical protein [Marinobacter sp.]MBE0487145.1 hypothetical protein [Marinobacter sp.]
MYAVEFETEIRDGVMVIPEKYARLKNTHARVVVLVDEDEFPSDPEVKALSNHTADTIDEWKDPEEDDIWT